MIDPAFPNPVSGAFVSIPVRVFEFNAVPGGLEVTSFDANNIARRLTEVREATDPGAYILSFNPRLLGRQGLVRVYIFDGVGQMVYGARDPEGGGTYVLDQLPPFFDGRPDVLRATGPLLEERCRPLYERARDLFVELPCAH